MHVVAIFDTSPADGSRAPALAAVLGGTVFDVRHRVVSPGPCVVGTFGDASDARALARRLDEAGFPALVRDVDAINGADIWSPVRSFAIGAESLTVSRRDGASYEVPWAAIHLVVRGTGIDIETSVETVKGKKFSMGRAVVTGGLVRNKKTKTEHTTTSQVREGFMHIYAAGKPISVVVETAVDYGGLGDQLQPARAANFVTLLDVIRSRAPRVVYDDRMLSRVGQSVLLGPRLDPNRQLRLASALIAGAKARLSG